MGPLLEVNLNQDFWKGLFVLTWDDDTKHWDTTREQVLMEFSILHLGHSDCPIIQSPLKEIHLCTFWVSSSNRQKK